ncbi:MAG: Hsp20/alpha crystallin family protein [Candidatus Yanofskybacteria bacterium]|nr:Hsp20/alpha crystallin family protein [Candidatus Yanofskybacteria bacterium]
MEDLFEENNVDPIRSREGSQRTPASNGIEVELASSKKESRQESEGQLTIDVFQTEDDVVIQSTIAGVSDKDLDISVTNDMVTIKGARAPEQKIRSSDYYYQELYWGAFSRSIILPVDVDADNAKASMKNGILTIRLPKLDKIRTKKIKVS